MTHQVEIREAAEGPTLYGVMLTEGRAASGGRREVFAPGSVEWPSNGVGVLLEHRQAPVTRAMPTREDLGRITLATPATPEIREAVEGGRKWMSVEMHALEERTTRGGVREVLRAYVPDVALVADPEYDTTQAEVRRRLGPSISSRVPTGRKMDCACPGGGCASIEFESAAFEGATEALATVGRLDQVIGNAVLTPGRRGLEIAVDLLDVEAARDLVSLVGGGVSIYARPLIDLEASDTSESRNQGGTLVVRRAVFHTVLVKAVAGGVAGLSPVALADGAGNRRGLVRVAAPSALEAISGGFSGTRREARGAAVRRLPWL